jgi:hypothetical protein
MSPFFVARLIAAWLVVIQSSTCPRVRSDTRKLPTNRPKEDSERA